VWLVVLMKARPIRTLLWLECGELRRWLGLTGHLDASMKTDAALPAVWLTPSWGLPTARSCRYGGLVDDPERLHAVSSYTYIY